MHLGTLFVLAFKMREILYALRKKECLGRRLPLIASGGFKSQQCEQLLTGPLKILFAGPPPNKLRAQPVQVKIAQASRSEGPSCITGWRVEQRALFYFLFLFCFFISTFFKPLKFVLGLPK